jgi:anthranilate synthase component 1
MKLEQLESGEAQVLLRNVARCPDPIEAFVACCGGADRLGTALLETAEVPDAASTAGKSFIVARSALRIRCRSGEVQVRALDRNGSSLLPWLESRLEGVDRLAREGDVLRCSYAPLRGGSEEERLKAPSPVDVLRRLLFGLIDRVEQPSAAPTLVGTFAYDLLESFEPLPTGQQDPLAWPDYEFFLPDRTVWLDHQRGTSTIVAHLFGGEHASSAYGDAMSAIVRLVEALEGAAREGKPLVSSLGGGGQPAAAAAPVEVDVDDQTFAALVERLKEHIVAGDVFQIVPSRTFSLPCSDPLAAYRELRASNPSPYMFFLNGAHGVLFGTSPETAVEVEGQPRHVHIRPIAGTRRRGRVSDGSLDLDLDSRLEAELRLNEKEVAEHMMLVDLARNDVARVSEPGTRRVDGLLQVHRYSHVMHLVSHVTGVLRRDLDALHAYVATMNMGTLVGAPKVRAAQLLRDIELQRRGPYGGGIGYLTADGRMDTGIVIRAAVVKDGRAHVRAGAGVVYDSEPLAEADETRRKAQAVLDAVWRAEQRGGERR